MRRCSRLAVAAALGAVTNMAGGTRPGVPAARGVVVSCPVAPNARVSRHYTLAVGETKVPVESFHGVHCGRLSFSGRIEVTIGVREAVTAWSISPKRRNIRARADGSRLRFALSRPGHLAVRINDLGYLFVFADPPAEAPPRAGAAGVVDISKAGVDATGRRKDTARIQAAIDALPARGVLLFPRGVYRTGALVLKSDMTLYVAGGAVIQGTADPNDYPPHRRDGRKTSARLILVDGAENVAIRGRGVIDANGTALRGRHGRRGRVVLLRNSRNVTVEGVILRDPPSWNTHILGCRHVTFRNVKLLNNPDVKNTDGFDPDASSHVLIDGCFAYCGDDAVAVKSAGYDGIVRDVEDIVVRRSVLLTRKSALKVGTESLAAVMKDVTFEGNDILLCDRGMALYCRDGATYANIRFVDNRFEASYPDLKRRLIDFSVTRRGGKGRIRDVLIRNCRADRRWPGPSTLRGLDAEHTIATVRFEGFRVAGTPCRTAAEAHVLIGEHVTGVTFSRP